MTEEKKIREFDGKVEHMMSDYSVTPSFGMWNRISAQLDAAAPVAPEVSPATPWFSTGAVVGFVSGALVIGTAVTGWLFYRGDLNNNKVSGVNNGVTNTVQVAPAINSNTQAVATDNNIGNANTPVAVVNYAKKSAPHVAIARPVLKEMKPDARIAVNESIPVIKNIIPGPGVAAKETAKAEDAYYFPPVDINTSGNKGEISKAADKDDAVNKDDDNGDDKRTKIASNFGSGKRIKFHGPRKQKFHYMRLNRVK